MDSFVPYILSVFSNPPPGAAGHLNYLDEERDKLLTLFTNARKEVNTHIDYTPMEDKKEDNLSSAKIADTIREFRKKLTIVHYSGHADQVLLSLNQEDLRAQNFARYISECEKVKIVVLNGCSTQGFVKRLLETTDVKAVIATDNPVRDDRAMNFSVQFYKRLLDRETVASAFTGALSVALNDYEKDSYIFKTNISDNRVTDVNLLEDDLKEDGTRGVKKSKMALLKENDKIATWGIYTRVNDVLDWNLFESDTDSEKKILQIEGWIRSNNAQVFRLEDDVETLERDIKRIDRVADPDEQDKADRIEKTTKIAQLRTDIVELRTTIAQLESDKISISEERNVDELIRSFNESLFNLNYKDQNNRISDLRKKDAIDKYSCFVLHGNTKSCLHLLSRRLRNWLGFDGEKKAIFDFDSSHIGSFWEKLQSELMGDVFSSDPEVVTEKLITFYRDKQGKTKNNFLLIFRNTRKDEQSSAVFNQTVFSFWKDFVANFRKFDKDPTYDHGIYAFIIDDTCELVASENHYKSSKEDDYLALYAKDEMVKPTFQLLPIVAPLDADVLWSWQQDSTIRQAYRYKFPELEKIITATSGTFLDTVEQLSCTKINNEASRRKIVINIKEGIDKPI